MCVLPFLECNFHNTSFSPSVCMYLQNHYVCVPDYM
ncbi:unnamed protein product [Brassica oleracea]